MNRLLVGDVGSGKTIVSAIACLMIVKAGFNVVLVAPTQILAEQHHQTFKNFFPELATQLVTAKTSKNNKTSKELKIATNSKSAKLYIGTHAVINQLTTLDPGLIVYDEQHRFGVSQRSISSVSKTAQVPHILTMSATPIPRSYMLTIFSHLNISLINQFPFGKKKTTTWFVPNTKKIQAYDWIRTQLTQAKKQGSQTKSAEKPLAIIICPFIKPSENKELAQVPNATQVFKDLQKKWQKELKVALLHGQQATLEQEKTIKQLFEQEIDVLVATSIVEVGLDLPQANIMAIEGADRFGLASLHQLRGRVGRKSQASFCLVFSSSQTSTSRKRLQLFAKENNGLKLAELDLENRGPGDLFGIAQHGLDNLRFASWNNAELIIEAKKIFSQLSNSEIDWQPIFNFGSLTKQTVANN